MGAICYQAEVTAMSSKAICCHLDGDLIDHWIPLSQIRSDSEVLKPGDRGRLIVDRWFAQTANLPRKEEDMSFEQKANTGSLFRNENADKNPAAPTMKGRALLELEDGRLVELDLAGWSKQSERAGYSRSEYYQGTTKCSDTITTALAP